MGMNPRPFNRCISEGLKLLIVLGAICVPALHAQEARTPQLPAPPPLRVIPREERAQLAVAKDAKTRLRKTIELAQIHLQHAEELTSQQKYEEVLTEMGRYLGLIDDALKFLRPMNRDSTKTRDLYKRLELDLRADGPRLTAMRRITPLEYAVRIKEIEDLAREGRTEALDSFYGHTVVRDGKKRPDDQKPKDSATKPENKQP
jgi:hypothetical protein